MLSLLNIDYSSMISTLPLDSGSSDSLSNFINNGLIGLVTEADTTYKIAGSVIALILALIGCFFGYKLSRLFMGITGFIAGAIIGQIVASQILHVEGLPPSFVSYFAEQSLPLSPFGFIVLEFLFSALH